MSTQDQDASAWCLFNGTKAYIYANGSPGSGTMNVYIDGDLQDTVDLSTAPLSPLVFQSNDLHFGELTFSVNNTDGKSINIICFLYRPHSIVSFTVDNLLDFDSKNPQPLESDVQYIEITGTTQKYLRFTRIWVVGPKGNSYGSFTIKILHENGNLPTQETVNPAADNPDKELKSVLLYQSPVLEYGRYQIRITTIGKYNSYY